MTTLPQPLSPHLSSGGSSEARADLPLLGMHCVSCAARVEKALNKAPGVNQATVNFATTRATVHYDPAQTNPGQLREAVKKAGYDAIVEEETPSREDAPDKAMDSEAQAPTQSKRRRAKPFKSCDILACAS